MKIGSAIRVDVDSVGADGVGTGTTSSGLRARLLGVLAGESVHARIEHIGKDQTIYARLTSVGEASPHRIAAQCPHYLDCGGCDLLHVDIAEQHRLERSWLARELGVPLDRIDRVVAAPRALGYRAFAKFVVTDDGVLGSFRPRSHDVVDMRGCLVHAPTIERIADTLRDELQRRPVPMGLRYVLIRSSLHEERAVVMLVVRSLSHANATRDLGAQLSERSDIGRIVLHENASDGNALWGRGPEEVILDRGAIVERIGPIAQFVEASAFSQVNPGAAAELYRVVAEASKPKDKRVLDLYSGSGAIALTLLAHGAKHVIGVERSPSAILAARRAAAFNDLEARVEFRCAPVEDISTAFASDPADIVIVNPPRKGLEDVVLSRLKQGSWDRLVYVSCNPKSLARDVRTFLEDGRVEVERIVPVDLFPQTHHIETVLVASRESGR